MSRIPSMAIWPTASPCCSWRSAWWGGKQHSRATPCSQWSTAGRPASRLTVSDLTRPKWRDTRTRTGPLHTGKHCWERNSSYKETTSYLFVSQLYWRQRVASLSGGRTTQSLERDVQLRPRGITEPTSGLGLDCVGRLQGEEKPPVQGRSLKRPAVWAAPDWIGVYPALCLRGAARSPHSWVYPCRARPGTARTQWSVKIK